LLEHKTHAEYFLKMPTARYLDSLKKLSVSNRRLVENELSLWKSKQTVNGIDCRQLAENIESESALSVTAFARLLKSFAAHLGSSPGNISFWKTVCTAHEFLGPVVPTTSRPRRLGRVGKMKDYADHIGKNIPKFAASHHLSKNAGKPKPLQALVRQMNRVNLSPGRILWATFSLPPGTDPLAGMPQDTDGITICLGLGCYSNTAPFIVMQYEMSPPSSPSLHKPTIADAGTYSFFRPSASQTDHWEMTEPLQPNPKGHRGRPELVHSQITGQSLIFPYFLSV
jgi:hypothetical protein